MGRKINEIHYTPDFRESYKALPSHIRRQVDKKDALFRENAFHPGLRTHKLRGLLDKLWSFWVTREYRVLFEFRGEGKVIFYEVGTHEIYR